jgi:DNA (cytosine-5)-methyltransferase 1
MNSTSKRSRKGIGAMRPIGIDLFAGAGGLSLGFEQAGFDVVGALEIDPIHCAVHKFNFPKTPVIASPIEKLTASEVREKLGLGSREVDCVFGGPPCQGFSLIGRRSLDDPRNRLAGDFVNLVAGLGARTFVFENVKGLTVGAQRTFLMELVEAFDVAGYDVRLPWRVLDAAQYGVPQHRERLFLLGAKRGLTIPDYPNQCTNPADRPTLLNDLPTGPTCEDAIGDLPDAEAFAALLKSDSVLDGNFGDLGEYARTLRCLGKAGWYYGYKRHWDRQILTSSARTIHTTISQRRFRETKPGLVEPISRFLKLSPDGLCNTLRAGTDGARGAFTSPRPIHYAYPRCITVREMARLHGFPDWFRFHATKWHGARQIGNSVPPPLGRAVASEIMRALGVTPQIPAEVLDLEDPSLLYMEMSEAAEHFGVIAPSGRRDRKSGAKKRKQHDIEAARLQLLKKRA